MSRIAENVRDAACVFSAVRMVLFSIRTLLIWVSTSCLTFWLVIANYHFPGLFPVFLVGSPPVHQSICHLHIVSLPLHEQKKNMISGLRWLVFDGENYNRNFLGPKFSSLSGFSRWHERYVCVCQQYEFTSMVFVCVRVCLSFRIGLRTLVWWHTLKSLLLVTVVCKRCSPIPQVRNTFTSTAQQTLVNQSTTPHYTFLSNCAAHFA